MLDSRILVVDDSPTIRSALTHALQSNGAHVTQANDGTEGLQIAMAEQYDLIVTDVEMPTMDGFTLCSRLKQHRNTSSVPVVILSTLDDDEHIEKGFQVGASAYVTKAEAITTLVQRVKDILAHASFLKKRTVLVVDDSDYILRIVSSGLLQAGMTVVTAGNGYEAVMAASDSKPDLVISDVNMPVMDGPTLLTTLKNEQHLASIPVVLMSTDADRALMRRMVQQGASAFLIKPFNIDQLVLTAEKLLSDHYQSLLQEKARLENERDLMLGTIASLVTALEARDPYTGGHSEAVSSISVAMAHALKLDQPEIANIETAARLHDLGKIGIRDELLLKPGKLTTKEYETFKAHTTHGEDILRKVPSLKPVLPAVRHHHERMDGSGYPDGLSGTSIPLAARIIAVADVYHALATDRPYRKAYPHSKAISILMDQRGTLLCPDCVDAFTAALDKNPSLIPEPAREAV